MKRNFITGIVILLPLVITIYVAKVIITLLAQPFSGLMTQLLSYYEIFSNQELLYNTSSFLALFTFCGLLIGLGYAASRIPMFNYFIWGIDFAFTQLPLVDKIYLGCKEIVDSLLNGEKEDLGQVVLVPFPNETERSIGFVVKRLPNQSAEELVNMTAVFIPGAPNPTTGYILLFRPEQIEYPDMEIDDGVKTIVSCGTLLNDFSVLNKK